jgi:hypothetical protein
MELVVIGAIDYIVGIGGVPGKFLVTDSLGVSVTQIFEGTQGRYNTNAILTQW